MALNDLFCADVLLRHYSLTHATQGIPIPGLFFQTRILGLGDVKPGFQVEVGAGMTLFYGPSQKACMQVKYKNASKTDG